jgi:hypothetical protein
MLFTQKVARENAAELERLKATLTPETIRATALAAGHSPAVAKTVAELPGATAAKLETITATHREKSAELDRLRAEVQSLRAQAAAQTSAPTPITAAAYVAGKARPTMTRSEWQKLPPLEQGRAIKDCALIPDPVKP